MAENQDEVTKLQQQLADKVAEVAELERERDDAREAQGKAEEELFDANQIIDDLNKQLEQGQGKKDDAPIVSYGVGKNARQFRITRKAFNFKGTVYKRDEIKSNSDVLKALIAAGAGVLQEVVEEEAE